MRLNAASRRTGRPLVDVPGIVGTEDLDSFFEGFGNGKSCSIVGDGDRCGIVNATCHLHEVSVHAFPRHGGTCPQV